MNGDVTTVFLIMFSAGALGGLLSYYMSKGDESKQLKWWQHIILGIGAAFIVPLLLNMISSSLMKDLLDSDPNRAVGVEQYFVLAGFCILAASTARSFIKSMSSKIHQRIEQAELIAREAKTRATTALDVLDEKPPAPGGATQIDPQIKDKLDDKEKRVINVMANNRAPMQSLETVASKAQLLDEEAEQIFESLREKGLIEQAQNAHDQPRWYPSSIGRDIAIDIDNI